MISIDAHDLDDLGGDLVKTGAAAPRLVEPSLHKAGNNIVRDARDLAPKKRLSGYAPSITYDIERDGSTIAVEVGPDRERNGQAKLGNIFEYGTGTLAPREHLGPALEHEIPNAEEHLGDALTRIVR